MEKSWFFVFFSRSHDKLIFHFQGKSSGKVMEFCTTRQFCARFSCKYYNVCLVMEVAVRGGHLYFSKTFKFMVKCTFDFVDHTTTMGLYPMLLENHHGKS